ncbi:hypothetical protein [Geobacter anodireducens]|uniref:Restriction endonuclease type IV Mrr domain-containing protein n=1 Tax=Geobacter anodireducens TaxID=1340425 RepID=A0ABR9NXZ9_9BACT|nr:hypothetical protein [Geobacter anodireducens]MBE2889140.1 hypothetical protein [Geobacter anodireducens]
MGTGGQNAIKGFLFQGIICLVEMLDDENWITVTVEPDVGSEIVDIVWSYPGSTKAVQVKSSINKFSKADIDAWAKELSSHAADNHELVLIGPSPAKLIDDTYHGVKVRHPRAYTIEDLIKQAAHVVDKYYSSRWGGVLQWWQREMAVLALIALLLVNSTKGKQYTREDLHAFLREGFKAASVDIEKELEDLEVFKRFFGFEAKPELRHLVFQFYNSSRYDIDRQLIKKAKDHFCVNSDGSLGIQVSVMDRIGYWMMVLLYIFMVSFSIVILIWTPVLYKSIGGFLFGMTLCIPFLRCIWAFSATKKIQKLLSRRS